MLDLGGRLDDAAKALARGDARQRPGTGPDRPGLCQHPHPPRRARHGDQGGPRAGVRRPRAAGPGRSAGDPRGRRLARAAVHRCRRRHGGCPAGHRRGLASGARQLARDRLCAPGDVRAPRSGRGRAPDRRHPGRAGQSRRRDRRLPGGRRQLAAGLYRQAQDGAHAALARSQGRELQAAPAARRRPAGAHRGAGRARRSGAPRRGLCARRDRLQPGDRAHQEARARALDPVLRPRHHLRADQALAAGGGGFPARPRALARAALRAQLSGLQLGRQGHEPRPAPRAC